MTAREWCLALVVSLAVIVTHSLVRDRRGGDGLVFAGSCSNKGHRFRTCDRCDGTGKPAVHP